MAKKQFRLVHSHKQLDFALKFHFVVVTFINVLNVCIHLLQKHYIMTFSILLNLGFAMVFL